MPQMAPINWLMMFFIFSLVFIMYNFINFFYQPKSHKTSNKSDFKSKPYFSWKW